MPSISSSKNSRPNNNWIKRPEEESSEAGISSSTSGSRPDRNGSSAPATESLLQSPAPSVESPSQTDPQVDPVLSFTASSTSGSTQETGPSLPSQPTSSEDSAPKTEASLDQPEDTEKSANELVALARQAYTDKEYALALELVAEAEKIYPAISDVTSVARKAIEDAQAAAN